MQNSIVHKFYSFCILLGLFGLLNGTANAETQTLHLTDGQTVAGDVVSMDERGIVLRQADGKYSDHIGWAKLSQDNLKDLQGNPKAAQFVEPFIELSAQDKAKRTEIEIRPVPRLERPATRSLIGGIFTSGIGIFLFVLIYAANIYAAYEIALFRAQSPGLVCGVAAVLPIIGPIIFLSMPTKIKHKETEWQPPAEEYIEEPIPAAAEEASAAEVASAAHTAAQPVATSYPPAKIFARGQFTFNRRFFETQVPGFFAVVRAEADRDMVMNVRSSRGTYTAQRISRVSMTEVNLQVEKEGASHDVTIPFIEIQEVQVKHRDAP
ncbi:hypothetical protein [Pedosphaera parvula]|nr:hypothetical protein [Pedosphaera parvula]